MKHATTITGLRISAPEAEAALTYLLLTEPGERKATRAFLIDGRLYKLQIERVDDPEIIPEVMYENF